MEDEVEKNQEILAPSPPPAPLQLLKIIAWRVPTRGCHWAVTVWYDPRRVYCLVNLLFCNGYVDNLEGKGGSRDASWIPKVLCVQMKKKGEVLYIYLNLMNKLKKKDKPFFKNKHIHAHIHTSAKLYKILKILGFSRNIVFSRTQWI